MSTPNIDPITSGKQVVTQTPVTAPAAPAPSPTGIEGIEQRVSSLEASAAVATKSAWASLVSHTKDLSIASTAVSATALILRVFHHIL